ncbi:MAG: peptide chain release factor N(5)-glutamine methyltransferase [Chitinispirillaceae bacterium]|nr:peptide chain release factor N(5)-glutamine methyltransferase [Chitinispirillaceae bacterium]
MVKIREIMPKIVCELKEGYGELALSYTERILQYVCNCTRDKLYLFPEKLLDEEAVTKIKDIVERCKRDEPLEYIIGKAFFYNREFIVTRDTLIPRPDTEILVEEILKNEKNKSLFFLELGTGSGIISCILTESNNSWSGIATDISFQAIRVAKKNCVSENMKLVCMDLFYAIKPLKQFDVITGNLPYVKSETIFILDSSVKDFEPQIALDGGKDGLFFYRKIAAEAPKYLKSGGRLYLEIGEELKEDIGEIFAVFPWKDIRFIKDNASRYRVVIAKCED